MANLRSIFRRDVAAGNSIRVVAAQGEELIGEVLDINQNGFRLDGGKKFKPGDMLDGLIQFSSDGTTQDHIRVRAQCVWNEGKELGFSIKEVPVASEEALDKLIDQAAGQS